MPNPTSCACSRCQADRLSLGACVSSTDGRLNSNRNTARLRPLPCSMCQSGWLSAGGSAFSPCCDPHPSTPRACIETYPSAVFTTEKAVVNRPQNVVGWTELMDASMAAAASAHGADEAAVRTAARSVPIAPEIVEVSWCSVCDACARGVQFYVDNLNHFYSYATDQPPVCLHSKATDLCTWQCTGGQGCRSSRGSADRYQRCKHRLHWRAVGSPRPAGRPAGSWSTAITSLLGSCSKSSEAITQLRVYGVWS